MNLPPELVRLLRAAQHVASLTGAGISAESGVPTFRQAQSGLWAQYDPQQLATAEAFHQNPQLVWNWYQWRRRLIAQARPNPGHQALVGMQTSFPRFTLITQNVDGLHQLAGSQTVIALHGNIRANKCFDCQQLAGEQHDLDTEIIPRCPACQGLLRPDVVWFGESLPAQALQAAWEAAEACDVFFSIGTSALVQPAAALPLVARQHGATLVEINPQPTPLSAQADFAIRTAAGAALPALLEILKAAA